MGTFYGVRLGPYASAGEPEPMCGALRSDGFDCLVVNAVVSCGRARRALGADHRARPFGGRDPWENPATLGRGRGLRSGWGLLGASMSAPDPRKGQTEASSELRAGLRRLVRQDQPPAWHLGARLRNYFLTGLVIVGPVTITLYFTWYVINVIDNWVKPYIPAAYLPDTICRFRPGVGLLSASSA